MTVAEASAGGWLGALSTFVGYGVIPLGIALYLLATPLRRAARRRAERSAVAVDPDRGGHPPGRAVAAEREEP